MSSVCVILVNYNTWKDTAECLESLLRTGFQDLQLVIIDNHSTNDSWSQLLAWASGQSTLENTPQNPLHHLSNPPATKPISYTIAEVSELPALQSESQVVFVRNTENAGFAGGNNIGLEYMLQRSFDYAWLLNNDTVVEPNAIEELVAFANSQQENSIGIIGSKLRLYHKPDFLQGLGAVFNPYKGTSKIIGAQQEDKGQFDNKVGTISYAIGAAMFVSRHFLQDVGLMSEDYFLYNEENDWSARGQRKNWKVSTAVKCIVYHKQGASTGNSPKKSKWQVKALQYKYRGKILLYKKYYSKQLPYLYMHLIKRSLKYISKGNFQEASVIYQSIFNTKFEK